MQTSRGAPVRVRRGLLGRGVLLAAGLLGVGLGVRTVAAEDDAPNNLQPAQPQPGVESPVVKLELIGRDWHLDVHGRKRGELPTRGDQLAGYGELIDPMSGRKVGEFYSSGVYLAFPMGEGPFGAATSEVHTFNLADGTIIGMGTSSGEESIYAIVGGTGRYVAARGSYVARQSHSEVGGDGLAAFRITLTA